MGPYESCGHLKDLVYPCDLEMTGTVRIVRSLKGSYRSVRSFNDWDRANCAVTQRILQVCAIFFGRDGASCSTTIRLPIVSSDFFGRDGASCSATIRLPIGLFDFFKRDGASFSVTIRSSGFRCAYDYKKRPSLFNYYLCYPVE